MHGESQLDTTVPLGDSLDSRRCIVPLPSTGKPDYTVALSIIRDDTGDGNPGSTAFPENSGKMTRHSNVNEIGAQSTIIHPDERSPKSMEPVVAGPIHLPEAQSPVVPSRQRMSGCPSPLKSPEPANCQIESTVVLEAASQ